MIERCKSPYTRSEFLRNLSERLMRIPTMYGTDQADCDELNHLAQELEAQGVGQELAPLSGEGPDEDD